MSTEPAASAEEVRDLRDRLAAAEDHIRDQDTRLTVLERFMAERFG